jgi:hypothetical protein
MSLKTCIFYFEMDNKHYLFDIIFGKFIMMCTMFMYVKIQSGNAIIINLSPCQKLIPESNKI